jgi:hypothetical protein
MEQRILQVDVNASRFSVLSYPQRHVLDSFEISHLVHADFPDELVIRLGFRQSIPGWISTKLAEISGNRNNQKSKKEQIWTRTFYTMSSSQRDYIGALLQGLVGLTRPLNSNKQLLCSPTLLRVGREQLTLWTGSWNMGNKPAPEFTPTRRGVSPSVRSWLILDERDFDVYVTGFQEMDAGVFAYVDQQLGPEYYQVAKTTMGVIGLAVYVRKRLLPHVKSVETVTSAAGFAGVGTNKGFVAAAMTIFEQPLLFICCHLAARDDATRLKQRVHQYKLASRRLKLGRLPGTDPFHQFTTFFFGDMNFRVCTVDKDAWPNSGRTRKDVIDGLYSSGGEAYAKGLQLALEGDQLRIEKERGAIFDQFKEFPIRFSPTYKYESFPRSSNWESVKDSKGVIVGHQARDVEATPFSTARALEDLGDDSNKVTGYYLSARENAQRREYTEHKAQVPSWCDRILHRALPPVRVEQTSYRSVDDIVTSDHSPVLGTFNLEVPQTSSSVPNAAFHVCSIQMLRVEVYCFRHPATPVHDFFAEAGKGGGGRDDDDEDDDDEQTIRMRSEGGPRPAAARRNSDASEPEIYSVKDANEGENGPHLKQLACAAIMPFMRDASTRSRVTSKPTDALKDTHTWKPNCKPEPDDTPEYIFTGKHLQGMAVGPFLTTREHLQSQWFVLHFLPRSSSETRESAAACIVSLAEAADGRSVNFEAKLQHNGQPSGFVRGKFRVWLDADGWDEEYVQNPTSHALNPKKLTKNFNASAHHPHRRKSPAPPGKAPMNIGDVDVKSPLPKLLATSPDEIDLNGGDEDIYRHIRVMVDSPPNEEEDEKDDEDDDPFLKLARENTIKNASTEVTGFRKFEPRIKKAKKKNANQIPTSEGATKDGKRKLLFGAVGSSARRLSMITMGWGSSKD